MSICATCGHDTADHYAYGQGPCGYRIMREDDREWRCGCERFRSLGVLIGVRVLVILACVAVLGTLEGLFGMVPR